MKLFHVHVVGALVLILLASSCCSYRILTIIPLKARSHFNVVSEIAKALAEKGHQVDVISHFPLVKKFPNYNDLFKLPDYKDEPETIDFNAVKRVKLHLKRGHAECQRGCRILEQPDVSNLINNPPTDPPYDLVLVHIACGYACFTAIAHLWNIPTVSVSTASILYPIFDHLIGTPLSLAIAPRNTLFHKETMNFWDRLYNFLITHHIIWSFLRDGDTIQNDIMKKYFGDRVPHYSVVQKSTSLMLSNSHYSLHGIRPKVPALVEIGGIHINDDNATVVNPNLKSLMDRSKKGFVYVSFGSRLIVDTFPKEVLNNFFAVFKKLASIQFIMKIIGESPTHLLAVPVPKNVHFFSWLPQLKILQHRNIKAFVTHGGGLSTQEAVYYAVPTICIPFFADQFQNCDIASNKNIGLKLDITTAKQEDFFNVFDKILNDTTYAKTSKKMSLLYRDRFKSPREEVVYWVEYVIRHGKNVLRSPSVDLEWWQVELLDVLAFISGVILLIASIAVFAVKQLFKLAVSKTKSRSSAERDKVISKKLN